MKMVKCLFILILLNAQLVMAQDWFDEPKKNSEPEIEDKGLITYAPSIRVMVPQDSPLKGKKLRVDGVPYPIGNFIDLPGVYKDEEVEIEVVADDGRILDYQFRSVEADMLRDFKHRSLQFRLAVGYRSTDDDKWDNLGIRPSGNILDFSANYFPQAWGFRVGMQRLKRSGKDKEEQLTEYEVTEIPILFGYDIVPAKDSPKWRSWQLRFWLGAVAGTHRLKTHFDQITSDDNGDTEVADADKTLTANTTGIHLGLEAMQPLTDRVWVTFEYALIHRSLEFSESTFATEKPINDFKVGLYFSI